MAVADAQGTPCYDTQAIIDNFRDFFQDVYSSKVNPSSKDIHSFLDKYPIPRLSVPDMTSLNASLTEEELLEALAHTQNGKAPGADGLPSEVYKRYTAQLIPTLLRVYNEAFITGNLPPSMNEAIIIVLLKPGKNALSPDSYRPISLLTFDVKLLARVLASRLAKCIQTVIHRDQSCFIPSRSTAQNLRRLFLNLQLPTDNQGNRAILSLDSAKALDSVEWPYLWDVLTRFGVGPSFFKWVQLLYNAPSARIRINGNMSESCRLFRGTRQGCLYHLCCLPWPLNHWLYTLEPHKISQVSVGVPNKT